MTIGIGILGAGTVGGTLIRRLVDDRAAILAKTGLDLEVRRVAVRTMDRDRGIHLESGVLTTDPTAVVADPAVDIIVEVMGGEDPAGDLVLAAIENGKPVVTANKALIAARGQQLIEAAEKAGVALLYEASVGGGIPIIRPLSETLAGEKISRVMGIVNGTTNYILTQMSEEGRGYAEALAAAQDLGYAEPDPTADVSGADAAAKAAILASLAFGAWVGFDHVYHEGIDQLSTVDLAFAAELGYTVKLLGIAESSDEGVSARVYPAMIRSDHPLASIRGATNAVYVEGPAVGELLFAGPGAGGDPTATAVLGDVIDAARQKLAGIQATPRIRFSPTALQDFGTIRTKWYVRLEVVDEPGVLAKIAAAFGDADVSIKSVRQDGQGDKATLLIVSHAAPESDQRRAVEAIKTLAVVREVAAVIRVESDEA